MRGLGCELDDDGVIAGDLRDKYLARLVGETAYYLDSRDWRHLLDGVHDQGATNTCVAWAFSTAIYLAGQAAGIDLSRPSVRHAYALGSLYDRPWAPISTGGRSPRRTAEALAKYGIIGEDRWPFLAGPVDEGFPLDLDVASVDARLTGMYTLGGEGLPSQIRTALTHGHFPIVAIQVRESFDDYRGGLYWPNGLGRGWHMIAACAHYAGMICFVNSWSSSWGDAGFVWIPDEVINGPDVADAVCVTAAPAMLR